jgi:hypothetical protein
LAAAATDFKTSVTVRMGGEGSERSGLETKRQTMAMRFTAKPPVRTWRSRERTKVVESPLLVELALDMIRLFKGEWPVEVPGLGWKPEGDSSAGVQHVRREL